jgi:hypothetical protein
MKLPLPPSWTEAAHALAEVLEAENAALRAADFAAAAVLLPVKRAAIERMDVALLIDPKQEIRDAAGRLDRLAQQNRSLLADGIGIQAQVMRIIASAVRATSAAGYGPTGQTAPGFGGYALSAKA